MCSRRILKYALALLLVTAIISLALIRLLGPKIGNTFSTISSSLPDAVPPQTPIGETGGNSLKQQFEEIDNLLSQSMQSSIAYNAPSSMKLDDTVTLELLISPSESPTQVAGRITETGQVVTATIEITPRMRAELIAPNKDAFIIQSIHESSEQLISNSDPTRWAWLVTARQSGPQTLTLVIYRLVKFEGQDYWREVQAYQADVEVNVSFGQRLQRLDWKWIGGILLTAILIPALWRWIDSRNKQNEKMSSSTEKEKPRQKTSRKKPDRK